MHSPTSSSAGAPRGVLSTAFSAVAIIVMVVVMVVASPFVWLGRRLKRR